MSNNNIWESLPGRKDSLADLVVLMVWFTIKQTLYTWLLLWTCTDDNGGNTKSGSGRGDWIVPAATMFSPSFCTEAEPTCRIFYPTKIYILCVHKLHRRAGLSTDDGNEQGQFHMLIIPRIVVYRAVCPSYAISHAVEIGVNQKTGQVLDWVMLQPKIIDTQQVSTPRWNKNWNLVKKINLWVSPFL